MATSKLNKQALSGWDTHPVLVAEIFDKTLQWIKQNTLKDGRMFFMSSNSLAAPTMSIRGSISLPSLPWMGGYFNNI